MSKLIEEYGVLTISVISVAFFLALFHYFIMGKTKDTDGDGIADSTAMAVTYNNSMLKLKNFNDDRNLIIDSSAEAPHFKCLTTNTNDYKVSGTTISRSKLMSVVKAFGDRNETQDLSSSVTVLAYKYELCKRYTDDNGNPLTNGEVVMEDVVATDKYGNKIKDSSGNYVMISKPKYNITYLGEITNANPIVVTETTEKYKVVYRVVNKSLKAEWSTFFIKEQ